VTAASVLDLFEETGAYLKGHFRLTSGLHSGEYLQCAKVLAWPPYAERLGRDLAAALRELTGDQKVATVVSPAIGGIVIGHEVARSLGAKALFTERDAATNEMVLRRGFTVEPGELAVVVEDVVTTGGSTREVVRTLQSADVRVLGAGSIIDRSEGAADVGVPRVALHSMRVQAYSPDTCPLCQAGIPVVKPGSRRT
jgi:orotate phosphoribosyltransferase